MTTRVLRVNGRWNYWIFRIDCCLKLLFAVNIFSHHGLFFFKGNFSGKETVDIFKKVTDRTDLKRHEVRVRSNLLVTHRTKRFFLSCDRPGVITLMLNTK